MKRCPQCGRDYTDDTLSFCLDDGAGLLNGPASIDEPVTAILPDGMSTAESPTRMLDPAEAEATRLYGDQTGKAPPRNAKFTAALAGIVVIAILGFGSYWYFGRGPLSRSGPDPKAYDEYLRAKVLVTYENRGDTEAAILLLQKAVKADPDYAPAWATLARAYAIEGFFFAEKSKRKEITQNAEVAVERALRIDPDLGEAYYAQGLLLWTHEKRFPHEQAIQAYKRALELDPTLDDAHHQLGLIYLHLGLFDKARAEIANTLKINPGNTLARFRYGVIDLYSGKYDDAYNFFKSTPFDKNPSISTFQMATVLFKLGRTREASDLVNEFLRSNPDDEGGVCTSVKAMILASENKKEEAVAAIKRANEIGRTFGHFHHTAYNIASAYALLKMPEEAVKYLQLAADEGFPCYPLFENDSVFKGISDDPAYVALMAKMKKQWEIYNNTL